MEAGNQIGPYQITREIGRGGMGVVYLARDTKLDREVAIKCLPEELAEDPDRLVRFEREATTLAQLSHPNVGGIYRFIEVRFHWKAYLRWPKDRTCWLVWPPTRPAPRPQAGRTRPRPVPWAASHATRRPIPWADHGQRYEKPR